jgi:hypothetical protein
MNIYLPQGFFEPLPQLYPTVCATPVAVMGYVTVVSNTQYITDPITAMEFVGHLELYVVCTYLLFITLLNL